MHTQHTHTKHSNTTHTNTQHTYTHNTCTHANTLTQHTHTNTTHTHTHTHTKHTYTHTHTQKHMYIHTHTKHNTQHIQTLKHNTRAHMPVESMWQEVTIKFFGHAADFNMSPSHLTWCPCYSIILSFYHSFFPVLGFLGFP
jgi:hypothetical protein